MHVSPLSYKIGACQIFVKNVSAKNKQIFETGLVQPGPNRIVLKFSVCTVAKIEVDCGGPKQ